MIVKCRGSYINRQAELDAKEISIEVEDATISVTMSDHGMVRVDIHSPNVMFAELKFDPVNRPSESDAARYRKKEIAERLRRVRDAASRAPAVEEMEIE